MCERDRARPAASELIDGNHFLNAAEAAVKSAGVLLRNSGSNIMYSCHIFRYSFCIYQDLI